MRAQQLLCLVVGLGCSTADSNLPYDPPEPAVPTVPPLETEVPPAPALPIYGGHGLVVGSSLFVADPERDRVFSYGRSDWQLWPHTAVALPVGSTPFRLANGEGLLFVSLRRGGAIGIIDLSLHALVDVVEVCAEPRGVAWDEARRRLLVACASGELVATTRDGTLLERVFLEPDLRDVVVDEHGAIFVSVFIAAEVLELTPALTVHRRVELPDEGPPLLADEDAFGDVVRFGPPFDAERHANTAWRMRASPGGGVDVLHQLSAVAALATPDADGTPRSYGSVPPRTVAPTEGPCVRPVVANAISHVGAAVSMTRLGGGALLVDFAWTRDGFVVASGGAVGDADGLLRVRRLANPNGSGCDVLDPTLAALGETVTSVEAFADGFAGYLRSSTRLASFHGSYTSSRSGGFSGAASVADVGQRIFHEVTQAQLACASCHAEGRDDGLVWDFGRGRRRTQSLVGGILATAPFHWKGDVPNMATIMSRTFEQRMGGAPLQRIEVESLSSWLDGLDVVAVTVDPEAAARGEEVFARAECGSCHAGPFGTSGLSYELDGERWQAPALRGVGLRAPFFHDGCAWTLRGALDGCRAREPHPGTASLTSEERDDLAAFLASWD